MPTLTTRSRYEIVGQHATAGTFLDAGARDRRLMTYLPPGCTYTSADIVPGHDYTWNLEHHIPAPDASFHMVAALDVLEHLDHLHGALRELLRITRRTLFISLPNEATVIHRLTFLLHGTIGGNHHLAPNIDRHRWLVTYHHAAALMRTIHHLNIQYDICTPHNYFLAHHHLLPPHLTAHTLLFVITKD
ncbi:MAG TPA: methyltransferase domain-containing protein [Anaerolineae bacterium]|nr:methyltransferase domain-containing protein [Anaerolineae bacterium]